MDALINGITPKEKMAQLDKAPPLKRLKSAATPPLEAASALSRNHWRRT
jgi:hypothetical protein